MLALILLTATLGLPLAFLYGYYHIVLKKAYQPVASDIFILGLAGSLQLLFARAQYNFLNYIPANFLHHAVGGGVVVMLMCWVVQRRAWPHMSLPVQFGLLIAIVNILGNANEVLELVADLVTDHYYVVSRLDTSIDLLANNVGALVGFMGLQTGRWFWRRRKQ